jgi:hypothetical protein
MAYEARHTWRHVAEDLVVKAAGAGVFGYGAWLLSSRPAEELGGGWPVVAVRAIGAVLAVAAVVCAVEAVTRLAQVSRRQLVVRVDADGVTLGPRWFWSAPATFPWSVLSGVSLASAARGGGGHGARTPDQVRVHCRDGAVHRRRFDQRRLDRHRSDRWRSGDAGDPARPAAGLAEALGVLAPDDVLLVGVDRPRRAA